MWNWLASMLLLMFTSMIARFNRTQEINVITISRLTLIFIKGTGKHAVSEMVTAARRRDLHM